MPRRRVGPVATSLLCLLFQSACTIATADSTNAARSGASIRERRAQALRHASVWTPVPVERMDVKAGPDDPRGFPFLATVACQYGDKTLRGHSHRQVPLIWLARTDA